MPTPRLPDIHICNIYSMTKSQAAIRVLTRAMADKNINMPPLPGTFTDYQAPIVRNGAERRELVMALWDMPSPALALESKKTDPGVTNIRNTRSPHRHRWLASRAGASCRSPASPSLNCSLIGSRPPASFALDETRPHAFLAGIWTR